MKGTVANFQISCEKKKSTAHCSGLHVTIIYCLSFPPYLTSSLLSQLLSLISKTDAHFPEDYASINILGAVQGADSNIGNARDQQATKTMDKGKNLRSLTPEIMCF